VDLDRAERLAEEVVVALDLSDLEDLLGEFTGELEGAARDADSPRGSASGSGRASTLAGARGSNPAAARRAQASYS
jgi:hypothetical protein